ncbi:MAG TPA: hypothetical protein VII44_09630 [Puia sp.]
MKKTLFALSLGFTSIVALSNYAFAQYSENPVAFNDTKNFKTSIRNLAALESPSFMGTYIPDAKNINVKAIKDFQGRFNGASNAMWFADDNGFVSYFVQNGYGNRAFYDKKGRWQYSLLFYGEDKLPRDIRATVKSTYFDLDITLVEEVQSTLGMAYIVHLEDKSNIKILRVSKDGEMDIMQELTKE